MDKSDDEHVETAGPPEVDRPEHEVDYLRRTPLRKGLFRRRPKGTAYIDTGAPPLRPGDNEDHVVYVRRTRMHRPWWRRPLIVIPLVLLILVAAGGAFVLTQRNVTTEVSLAKVVERFEAQEPELTEDRGIEELDASRSPGSAVTEPQQEDTARTASGTDARVAEAPNPYVLPAEGVYLYKTRGGEKVSVFGASHTYPDRTYSTVRHTGGCRWEQRIDVIEEHVDIRKVCSRTDELLQIAQARYVTFFGQRKGDENVCEPWASFHQLEDRTGARATATCRGEQGEARLVRVFEGVEPYVIEGEIEQVVKVRIDATFTGKTEGESMDQYWLSRRTGFPLRWDRTVDAVTSEFGTEVRYTEEASFELVSLDPQR